MPVFALPTSRRRRRRAEAWEHRDGERVWTGRLKYAGLVAVLCAFPVAAAKAASPQCFVTGGGYVGEDSFGMTAKSMRDGMTEGEWHHRIADGHVFDGDVDAPACRRDCGDPEQPAVEFSIPDFGGTMTMDGQPGYTFIVRAQDHGEGNGPDDIYQIVVEDADGNVAYTTAGFVDGNVQIHATNGGHP